MMYLLGQKNKMNKRIQKATRSLNGLNCHQEQENAED